METLKFDTFKLIRLNMYFTKDPSTNALRSHCLRHVYLIALSAFSTGL